MGAALAIGAAEIGVAAAEAGEIAATAAEIGAGIGEAGAVAGEAAAAGTEAAELGTAAAELAEGAQGALEATAESEFFGTEVTGLATSEEFALTAEEAALPEGELTGDFEAWYQSEFSEELGNIQSFEEPGALPEEPAGSNLFEDPDFDITTDPTVPDYASPEAVQAAVDSAQAEAAAASGTATASPSISQFEAPVVETAPEPTRPMSQDELQDILQNLNNTDYHSEPEGHSWQDILDALREHSFEFATQYFTKQELKRMVEKFTEKIAKDRANPVQKPSDLLFLDPQGNIVNVDKLLKNHSYIDPFRLGYSVGRLTSHSVFEFNENNGISEGALMNAIIQGTRSFPEGYHIADKLYDYISNTEEFRTPEVYTDDFSRVAGNYHGRVSEPYLKDGVLHIQDEIGEEIPNYGNDTGLIVPPLWGNYCGMFSPNNKPPQGLLDTYCYLHDQDYYTMGTFSKFADMKLVSRISQNIDKMEGSERIMARFVVNYFSKFGPIMSSFTRNQSIPDRIGPKQVELFDFLLPQHKQSNQRQLHQQQGRLITATEKIRKESREHFYSGLQLGAEEALMQEALKQGIGPPSQNKNKAILEMFDNLVVTVE